METLITVFGTVNAPVEKVWIFWTSPQHITQWNKASPDWHTPHATNDLRVGGKFLSRMEARDGSAGFDFNGIYTEVKRLALISYTIEGGRKVKILFNSLENTTTLTEVFEAENIHSIELQRTGWQSILDNFKKYTEST